MNLFGYNFSLSRNAKDAAERNDFLSRSRPNPLGPMSQAYAAWQPGRVSAPLYESLRENIGLIDRALGLLVCFDGIVGFEGNNQKLVDEITDWANHVRVNDTQFGLQAFLNNFSNEAYEQGHMVAQYVATPALDDIEKLVVADSKDIIYIRGDKGLEIWYRPSLAFNQVRSAMTSPTERVQDILQGRFNYASLPSIMGGVGYTKIEGENVILYSVRNENQNPYGTSYLRSIPFVAQILLTIHNSVRLNWERYGDPPYKIIYKGTRGDLAQRTLEQRQKDISDAFAKAMEAKKKGTTADFVMAIGKDSELDIEIIGAEGKVMQMELPSRSMLEQIVASLSLPPNLLGLQWSSTERNAQYQVEVALQEGVTRANLKTSLTERLIMAMLRLRGRSWARGDWRVVFKQPNLHDQVASAQANFLNAQADQMRSNGGAAQQTPKSAKVEVKGAAFAARRAKLLSSLANSKHHAHKSETPNPVSAPLVSAFSAALAARWQKVMENYLRPIMPKGMKTAADDMARMRAEVMSYISDVNADTRVNQGPVAKYMSRAYSLGVTTAADDGGLDSASLDPTEISDGAEALYADSMQLVKDSAMQMLKDKINPVLASMNGEAPDTVANALQDVFGGQQSYWDMFARSEITIALENGKIAEWVNQGINNLDFVPADGACEVCQSYAGSYPVDECPVPAEDTHPNCTCATTISTEGND